MFETGPGASPGLEASPTVAEIESSLGKLAARGMEIILDGKPLFEPGSPIVISRAPGRLDVMGGIADYSGALVLQWPIREATQVAVQAVAEPGLSIVSLAVEEGRRHRSLSLDAGSFAELIGGDYAAARARFARDPGSHWAAYVAGVILVLARECGLEFDLGMRVLIDSRVPEGKGVSSSAALETAAMEAVTGLVGLKLEGAQLARLCQMAENFVVGAPCGIMDQMTSALGQADALLALLCQPAEIQGFVRVPESIRFWGIDSGIRHAVSGSDYTSVRTGAFMGYRIIADLAGLSVLPMAHPGVVRVDDPRWSGYLANVSVREFEEEFAARLPETINGRDFLDRFGGTTDTVTRVDPERNYSVRQPTAHPVHEHERVRRFAELLGVANSEGEWHEMGNLMYASHASYSACGLGSDGTDLLVELVRRHGPEAGLYGAKITGGGSGGTVAILGRAEAGPAISEIARRYHGETRRNAYLFEGSSAGASYFGARRFVF